MLFVELRFLAFFLVVWAVVWTLRRNGARKLWLLLCSHVFYACFFVGDPLEFAAKLAAGAWGELPAGWWFPAVLAGSTCMDYVVGLGIGGARDAARRRAWLLVSLAVNLGVLCFFKYFDFFAVSASDFLHWSGIEVSDWTLRIFLPYGISFYTFQSMSYSIEVYRGRLAPERSFLDLAFFIAFFPQLVAGPIVRALTFLPQTKMLRRWSDVDVRGALVLFLVGFVKKACVSETVVPVVDDFFAAPQEFGVLATWIGVLFYAVQIYCDFSGYSDMAIATARLLGYELTLNFAFPYLAPNITEFWRRWHISLSTWLRDYLYIPLGGNRGSEAFRNRNLMLTMLLGGLWHGASWNFVIWGALHGAALIVHRAWQRLAGPGLGRAAAFLGVPLTFFWVCMAWVPFRATALYRDGTSGATLLRTSEGFQDAATHALVHDFDHVRREPGTSAYRVVDPASGRTTDVTLAASGFQVTTTILESFVLLRSHGTRAFGAACLPFFLALALVHWAASRGAFRTWWRRLPGWAFAAALGASVALALFFAPAQATPFIYFQF